MGSISTRIDTDFSYLVKPRQIKEYSIVFKNGEEIVKIVKGPEGTPVSCPDVEKEGYDFNGWSINGETPILPVDTIIDCDITYVALWFAKKDVVEVPTVQLADEAVPAEPGTFSAAATEFEGEPVEVEVDDDPTVLDPDFGASPVIEDEDPVEAEVDDDPTVLDDPVLGEGTGIQTSWIATEEPKKEDKKGKGGRKKKN
jgi:hypothetical protein